MFAYASTGKMTQGQYCMASQYNSKVTSCIEEEEILHSTYIEGSDRYEVPSPWLRSLHLSHESSECFLQAMAKHVLSKLPVQDVSAQDAYHLLFNLPGGVPINLIERWKQEILTSENLSSKSMTCESVSTPFALLSLYLLSRAGISEHKNSWLSLAPLLHNMASTSELKQELLFIVYEDTDLSGNIHCVAAGFLLRVESECVNIRFLCKNQITGRLHPNLLQSLLKILPSHTKNYTLLCHCIGGDATSPEETVTLLAQDHAGVRGCWAEHGPTARAIGALLWSNLTTFCSFESIKLEWHSQYAVLPFPHQGEIKPLSFQVLQEDGKPQQRTLWHKRCVGSEGSTTWSYPQGYRLLWSPAPGNAWLSVDTLLYTSESTPEEIDSPGYCGISLSTHSSFLSAVISQIKPADSVTPIGKRVNKQMKHILQWK